MLVLIIIITIACSIGAVAWFNKDKIRYYFSSKAISTELQQTTNLEEHNCYTLGNNDYKPSFLTREVVQNPNPDMCSNICNSKKHNIFGVQKSACLCGNSIFNAVQHGISLKCDNENDFKLYKLLEKHI